MRKLIVIVGLVLVAAACGGNAESDSSAAPSPQNEGASNAPASTAQTPSSTPQDSSSQPDEDSPAETAAPTESTEASGPSFDGPPAPDFELALNDGSTFRLSDEAKPVYMVFWAEW